MLVETDNFVGLIFWIFAGITLLPIISLFGHIFTSDGREMLAVNPFMGLYFIIFGIVAYFFWMEPLVFYEYTGIPYMMQRLLYGCLCVVPILEKNIPN